MNIDINKALNASTSYEFDGIFSTKMHGITNVDDYYSDISCMNELNDVRIPLLCINSLDDPIIHHSTIPFDIASKNDNIILLVTKIGGHVGFFEGLLNPKRWYIKPTL